MLTSEGGMSFGVWRNFGKEPVTTLAALIIDHAWGLGACYLGLATIALLAV